MSSTASGYVVLARKWRPMTFSDLVGQGHVSQTLANAIAQNRVAHAFLFTGVRGVGKTTSARILAKALNCLTSDGPTATPCLSCAACKEIAEGSDVDVQEIDGASYNGVDEVRRLQEGLPYRPNRDRYKIIIVDEVHMLSTNAWNAFLKTLEEPPPHVKFIFATTEVHKVPITILSRVQRFDFKLIPARLIQERLRHVVDREGIQADDGALSILARQAAGSMRDAMSLLDQVIAWSQETLTGDAVARVLGVASRKALHDLLHALVDANAEAALRSIDAIANQGFDIVHVARDLLGLLRDTVVTTVCEAPEELVDLPPEELAEVRSLTEIGADDLLRLHQGFAKGFDQVARSAQPRAALEMLLVKLARRPPLVPIDDLIDRLSRLEQRASRGPSGPSGAGPTTIGGGRPSGERPPPGRAPVRARSASPTNPRAALPEAVAAPSAPTAIAPPPTAAPDRDASTPPMAASGPVASAPTAVSDPVASMPTAVTATPPTPPSTPPAVSSTPRKIPSTAPAVTATPPTPPSTPPAVSSTPRKIPSTPPTVAPHPVAAAPPAAPAGARSVPPSEPASDDVAFEELPSVERWRRIVDPIRANDPKLGAFLDHLEVLSLGAERIHLRVARDSIFHAEVTSAATVRRIAQAAAEVTGSLPEIAFAVADKDDPPSSGETVAGRDKQVRAQKEREEVERARSHPVVLEAVRVFGARVRNIDLPKNEG